MLLAWKWVDIRDIAKYPQCIAQPPKAKNYWVYNVYGAELEKPSYRVIYRSVLSGQQLVCGFLAREETWEPDYEGFIKVEFFFFFFLQGGCCVYVFFIIPLLHLAFCIKLLFQVKNWKIVLSSNTPIKYNI